MQGAPFSNTAANTVGRSNNTKTVYTSVYIDKLTISSKDYTLIKRLVKYFNIGKT